MIEYLISSLVFNVILFGYVYYKTMFIPKKYKRVIIIEEKSGARQIRFDWCKEQKGNTIKLLNKKATLQYDTESKKEDGVKAEIDFIDTKGRPAIILRTNGEKYTYCTYDGVKITGLTKDQRIWFTDQAERVTKQYNTENAFGRFLDKYGRDVIWCCALIGISIILVKFAGEPSEQMVDALGSSISRLIDAVGLAGDKLAVTGGAVI